MAPSTFGRSLRAEHFMFDKDYVPLNHGSFGTCPRIVWNEMIGYQKEEERNPDLWLRYKYYPLLEKSTAAIASLVNAEPSSVVFVSNATTAANVVMRSLKWNEGDVIFTVDTIYSGVQKLVEYIVETTPAQNECLDIHWPISDDALMAAFEDGIKQINVQEGRRVRLAILDTVTSNPGLSIPYGRLTHVCRKHNVLSLVDGAHGIGHLPLDLSRLDADFFFSNIHKWLFVPRGCAFLQVPARNQHLIKSSLPTSHGYMPEGKPIYSPLSLGSMSPFQKLFAFIGTINSNNWLTIPTALKFRAEVCGGEEAIMRYSQQLARKGGDRAAQILGTDVLDNEEGTLRDCAFASVRVPLNVDEGRGPPLGQLAQLLIKKSTERYTLLVVAPYNGKLYWRISGQCYLDMNDMEYGAKALKEICEEVQREIDAESRIGRSRL